MQGLDWTLEVDRATLYRWVGSREHLLAEVLWSMMDKTIQRLRAEARAGPVAGGVLTGVPEASRTNAGTRTS